MLLSLFSCTVTSEKYRYQKRVDHYTRLLNAEETSAFRANRMEDLASSFSGRIGKDPKLASAYQKVLIDEAIPTFSVTQAASFYREILMRELTRPLFYQLMNALNPLQQEAFVRSSNFAQGLEQASANADVSKALELARKEYRLNGYSPAEIADFFRTVSFPQVSRRELYPLLSILKTTGGLPEFLAGKTADAAQKLEKKLPYDAALKEAFAALKERTSLTKVGTKVLLDLYLEVIMKEMDPYALKQTLSKF